MRGRPPVRAVWLVVAGMLLAGAASAQAAPVRVRDLITYKEFQDRSGAPESGRLLKTGKGPQGIDVDSSVRIEFNRPRLVELLGPPSSADDARLADFRKRIEQLTWLTNQVEGLARLHEDVVRAFKSPDVGVATYERLLRERSVAYNAVFEGLHEAVQKRRLEEGASPEAALAEANAAYDSVVPPGRYDFVKLGQHLDAELRALNRVLETRLDAGASRVGVEVRAHLVRSDGSSVALRLVGYNNEAAGPSVPYRRLQTQLSSEEKEAYAEYEKLAKEIGEAKNVGAALRKALEQLYPERMREVQQALGGLATQVGEARTSLEQLAEELQPAKLQAWLTDPNHKLPPDVEASLRALADELQAMKGEFEAFEQLRRATLEGLPTMTPLQAHDALVVLGKSGSGLLDHKRWARREAAVLRFFQAVEKANLPDALTRTGPLKAALDVKTQLVEVVTRAQAVVKSVQGFIKFLSAGGLSVVADLPEPVNQQRRSGALDLDTTADLKTARGERQEGDTLVINQRFYVDDRLVEEWEDRFVLNVYGVRSKALAGLAFWSQHQKNQGVGTWKPTPTIGWYVNARCWPGDDDNGLRTALTDVVGVGVSVLAVDFDPNKDVELGVGGALTFFNNFAQAGYGLNLNVEGDRGFFFFTIRPLELGDFFSNGSR